MGHEADVAFSLVAILLGHLGSALVLALLFFVPALFLRKQASTLGGSLLMLALPPAFAAGPNLLGAIFATLEFALLAWASQPGKDDVESVLAWSDAMVTAGWVSLASLWMLGLLLGSAGIGAVLRYGRTTEI